MVLKNIGVEGYRTAQNANANANARRRPERQRENVQQRERATEGGLVEHGVQRRLDARSVRERRPYVAVALVSWKWQK